jgi:hypothetical protein
MVAEGCDHGVYWYMDGPRDGGEGRYMLFATLPGQQYSDTHTNRRPFILEIAKGNIFMCARGSDSTGANFTTDNGDFHVGYSPGNGPGFRFNVEGDAYKSGAGWLGPSDERLKEDIETADVDVCYDTVKNLDLKYYKYRDDMVTPFQNSDRHRLGWIAQEVESFFPKAVRKTKMYDIEDCYALDNDQIYAAVYGATKKLITVTEGHTDTLATMSQLITALQQQNALLQQQNYDLHARVMVLEQGAQQPLGVAPLAQDAPLEPQPVPEPESDPAPSPETQDPVEDPAAIVEVIPEAEEATPEPEAEEATPEPEAAI